MTLATVLLLAMVLLAAPAYCQPGAAVFKERCAKCHGETGKTDTSVARGLKVAPLVNDPRLARMTPAEIVRLVKADPKHSGVVDLRDADLEAAAIFVRELAKPGAP